MVRWLKVHYDLIQALLPAFLVAAVLSVVGLAIRGAQESTNRQIHSQLVEGCVRLNILRAEDNVSHYADYKVFSIVLHFRGLDGLTPVLRNVIKQKAWTPLTNCAQAVSSHGVAYRPPHPIPFYIRLPARSALSYP